MLANDFDPEGDPLRVVSVTNASIGAVEIDDFGRVLYTPPVSLDLQTIVNFRYTITDTAGARSSAAVAITLDAFAEITPTPTPIPDVVTEPTPTPTAAPSPTPEVTPIPFTEPEPTPTVVTANALPVAVSDERGPVSRRQPGHDRCACQRLRPRRR